jgi:hypothetical protein
LGTDRFFPPSVDHVLQGHDGMPVQHAGAGITHHSPDLFPHLGLVAVHGALGTGRFALLKWTALQALPGIASEYLTVCAQVGSGAMLVVTVEL